MVCERGSEVIVVLEQKCMDGYMQGREGGKSRAESPSPTVAVILIFRFRNLHDHDGIRQTDIKFHTVAKGDVPERW